MIQRGPMCRENGPLLSVITLGVKWPPLTPKSGIERYMRLYGVCSVGSLPGTYFPRGVSIAVRKNTPYLRHFDDA